MAAYSFLVSPGVFFLLLKKNYLMVFLDIPFRVFHFSDI